jgi:hypothetical protein
MNLITALFLLAVGATVSLNWQAGQDPSIIGYTIHYGQYSSVKPFPTMVDVGNVTGVTFTHISTNKQYCFATTQYRYSSGTRMDSGYSNIQCGTIQPHDSRYGMPNYRVSGTPVYPPDGTPLTQLPDCTQCHSGATP